MKSINVPIDKAGRIVLPKSIRKLLNLSAGDEFQVTVEGQSIQLQPIASAIEPELIKKQGVLVYRGMGKGSITNNIIENIRSERFDEILQSINKKS